MNHSEAHKALRDFLKTPDDPALLRKALRILAHDRLREYRQQKQYVDDPPEGARPLCPRCWGAAVDEIGSEKKCRRCKGDGTLP